MGLVTIATVSMTVCYNAQENVQKYLGFIEQSAKRGAKLVVFPEQSMQGYLPSLFGPLTPETIQYQQENAEVIPEGELTQVIIGAAQKYGIYIVWGMTERDRHVFDVIYNSAVLVGPEGFIGSYRKVHLPLDELHIYYAGDHFPVYDTEIGRIGMMICYDKLFPESARELALQGAEIIVLPTAWPGRDPAASPAFDRMAYLYRLYDCVRAGENNCWFISSNQFGTCGDTNYYGHSNIVEPGGTVVATTGYSEDTAYAAVDMRAELLRARTRDLMVYPLRDRKPAAYRRLSGGCGMEGRTPLQNKDNCFE